MSLSRSLASLERKGYLQKRLFGHYGDGEVKVALTDLICQPDKVVKMFVLSEDEWDDWKVEKVKGK